MQKMLRLRRAPPLVQAGRDQSGRVSAEGAPRLQSEMARERPLKFLLIAFKCLLPHGIIIIAKIFMSEAFM